MPDKEKVMRGLERCASTDCTGCPYQGISPCQNKLAADALALLKEQTERIQFLEKWTAYLEGGDPYEGKGVLTHDRNQG